MPLGNRAISPIWGKRPKYVKIGEMGEFVRIWGIGRFIVQTDRIYSGVPGESTRLAVCSRAVLDISADSISHNKRYTAV